MPRTPAQRAAKNAYMAEWRKRNPEKVNAWRKRFTDRNPDYMHRYREANRPRTKDLRLQNKYGIDLETFESMVIAQNNLCALCDEPMTPPNVDHCHLTGKVRGLLCTHCNRSIGSVAETPAMLQRLTAYLT